MVDLLTVILAGIAATLVMTGFSQLTAYLLKKPFYVVIILATMLPFNKDLTPPKLSTYVAATILHYFIGIVFAYVHLWLILNGHITNNVLSALLYGVAIGTIAIIGWRLFFIIHPNPPSLEATYFVMIWLGHIWLSITAAVIFSINPLSTPAIENL
jgi:hypothetical protein